MRCGRIADFRSRLCRVECRVDRCRRKAGIRAKLCRVEQIGVGAGVVARCLAFCYGKCDLECAE